MKKILLLLLSVAFAFACTNNEETDNTKTETDYTADSTLISHVKIDTQNSTIKWVGSKITESHEGTVNIYQGVLNIIDGKLEGGEFVIDMNTIKNTDQSDELNKKLEKHLKNEDFFDVKKYPRSLIKITDATQIEGSSYDITADLTIKDITHPINFDADVKIEGLNYVATAKITINRTKWDVKYKSKNFVKNLGDKFILDEMEFEIDLVSKKL